jgi:hypothetical protein
MKKYWNEKIMRYLIIILNQLISSETHAFTSVALIILSLWWWQQDLRVKDVFYLAKLTEVHRIKLSVHVQNEVHLKRLALTKQPRNWNEQTKTLYRSIILLVFFLNSISINLKTFHFLFTVHQTCTSILKRH